ncbi:hypothetical protein AAG570_001390 [Ranatra chinensis]|uniref:Peptidase S1 domain-containing protein n=1 Tax=Ranatra chinensis TaxID=642074 RepID=A0ABD0YZY9_9HEMI
MVALARVGIMNSVSVFCGASIITKHHLLTAAHCTHGNTAQLAVIVGRESAHTKRYLVNQVFNHEGFSMTTVKHDIAVLAVHVGIEFNEHVGPVCLPKKPVQLDNEWVKVTGWGRMHFEGKRSDVLNKVYLKVVPIKSCASMYTNIATTNPTQFCTFRQGKDSCMGDSGGPVVWLDPDTNMYTLVGLVSYGKGCADSVPGVNTMVHEYLDWVQDKIRSNYYV